MTRIASFAILLSTHWMCISGRCIGGDAVCHRLVGASSWCKPESNTCHGKPTVSCKCEAKAAVELPNRVRLPAKQMVKGCKLNHQLCISSVGPHSWCRENKTCKDGAHIFCGCDKSDAAEKQVPKAQVAGSAMGTHDVCTRFNPASWCREDKRCQGFPAVACGRSKSVPVARAKQEYHHKSNERSFVVWAEWPSLRNGAWSEYFSKLLSFVRSNCGNFKVERIVMRILDPEFQSDRGNLWQVSTKSSFFKDFLKHLPASVEVYVYPYLMERASAARWSEIMQAEAPLEATFKFVKKWNKLLQATGVQARLAGVVTDKEEKKYFDQEIGQLANYKNRYSTPGGPRLRFGWAIGFDSVGSLEATSPEVDDVYLEMYDFYVNGISPAVAVEAHELGALNDPETFINILDEKVWSPHVHKYTHYPNIVFMWSLQNRESKACNYPLLNGTCGERVDMGSWSVSAFNKFLDKLDLRHPVFSKRKHGLFQFNYLPHSWQQCPAQ